MAEPIRVLHVLQRMEAGGTQAFLMNLYRNVDRSKVQFDFLVEYTERQFYDDEIESLGGHVYRASFREDHDLPRFRRFLGDFFAEHGEYRIVHCHAYTVGYFVLKAAEEAGVTVRIAHSHNNNMSGTTVPLKLVMRLLFPVHATHLMAASTEAGRFLFGDRPFTVAKNAIDVDRFRFDPRVREEVRSELGLGDAFVVGNVGRLHQQKNQAFLLDAFAELSAAMPEARLLMVGSGPLHDQLVEKVKQLGIDGKTTLLSNRGNMDRLYQAMDVFALPSLYEGLGIVAIEAQSAGLPTICSTGVAEDANVSPLFQRMSLDDGAAA
jgi:glycosyltransferase involved in cell wall biosynthesis